MIMGKLFQMYDMHCLVICVFKFNILILVIPILPNNNNLCICSRIFTAWYIIWLVWRGIDNLCVSEDSGPGGLLYYLYPFVLICG